MSQGFPVPACLEDVEWTGCFSSELEIHLVQSSSTQGLIGKPHLGPVFASSLQPTCNLLWVSGHPLPSIPCTSSGIHLLWKPSKGILCHGHSQVTWASLPVSTRPQIKALNQQYEFSMKTRTSTHKTFLSSSSTAPEVSLYFHIMAMLYEKVRQNSCKDLSLVCWVTVALAGPGWRWVRISILAERTSVEEVAETQLRGAWLATGTDVSPSIKPSFRGGWAFLLMLWCSEHDSTRSQCTTLKGHMGSLSSAVFWLGCSCHHLFLSPCISIQVIS